MIVSGSPWALGHLCLHLAKDGKRIKTLHVPACDWAAFGCAVADRLGTFAFQGERGCIEIAPMGYKVQVFCDHRLGNYEWRWSEEPLGE